MIARELHDGASFWSFLLSIDKDLAECTRRKGCSCGGRLHRANYPRAPRGGPIIFPRSIAVGSASAVIVTDAESG